MNLLSSFSQSFADSRYRRLAIPSTMLDTQYRMHPDISTFPSKEFYGAALKDGTLDRDGNAFPHLSAPVSSFSEIIQPDGRYLHVLFLDHGGSGGYETKRDSSYENIQEAKIICSVIEDLLIRNPVS